LFKGCPIVCNATAKGGVLFKTLRNKKAKKIMMAMPGGPGFAWLRCAAAPVAPRRHRHTGAKPLQSLLRASGKGVGKKKPDQAFGQWSGRT
jgi:hypothetical protein